VLLAAKRPCLVFGELALRAHVPARQAAFVAGKHVTYFMPGFYARALVPRVTALKAWVLAAIRMLTPRISMLPEIEGLVIEAQRLLEAGLPGDAREELAEPIAGLAQREAPLDVSAWATGVDLTADRVGLVTAGDLPTALAVLRATGDAASNTPLPERERQLLEYSVSKRHLELRAKYRLGVGERAASSSTAVMPPA
jgi:hypothetical protein